eukprot:7389231-Prymnesium_polylepis.2
MRPPAHSSRYTLFGAGRTTMPTWFHLLACEEKHAAALARWTRAARAGAAAGAAGAHREGVYEARADVPVDEQDYLATGRGRA